MLVRVAAATVSPWSASSSNACLHTGRGLNLDSSFWGRPSEARDRLKAGLESGVAGPILGKPGGVFVMAAEKVPDDDRVLLAAAARAVLGGRNSSLADQLDRRAAAATVSRPTIARTPLVSAPAGQSATPEGLRFWNGFGGFTPDGREYVIVIDGTARGGPGLPPAPWTNVLANPGFGCLVTEAGLGYSWAGNSQMNRLTPWSNDPVSDPPGEAIYLRDEETGINATSAAGSGRSPSCDRGYLLSGGDSTRHLGSTTTVRLLLKVR